MKLPIPQMKLRTKPVFILLWMNCGFQMTVTNWVSRAKILTAFLEYTITGPFQKTEVLLRNFFLFALRTKANALWFGENGEPEGSDSFCQQQLQFFTKKP